MIEPYYKDDSGILYCGDCLEILPQLSNKLVDLVLTDPPYGETNQKWDTEPDYTLLCPNLERIIKDDGLLILFGKFKNLSNFYSHSNLDWFCEWIWEKPKSTFTQYHLPICVHETLHCYRKSIGANLKINIDVFATFEKPYVRYQTATKSKTRAMKPVVVKSLDGKRHPRSVIFCNTAGMNEGELSHFCPKPLDLITKIVRAYSRENNVVIDPFLGSGQTAIACEMLGRRWIGIEINPKYCDIAVQRLKAIPDSLFKDIE